MRALLMFAAGLALAAAAVIASGRVKCSDVRTIEVGDALFLAGCPAKPARHRF